MYTLELGVFMYKYSIIDLPVAFKEYFMKRSDIHDYPTRHVNNLNLTNNRKSFSDHAIRTNGPILWNSLSKTIRVCFSLTKGTFSGRLLLSNQDKGCIPSVAHSVPTSTSTSVLGRPGLVSRQVVQRHIRCWINNKLYTPTTKSR